MARFFRQEFDRGRDFVALRGFLFNAQGHAPGQPIDKTAFSLRRLRQLFDMRNIGYPEEITNGKFVPTAVVPSPEPVRRIIERYRPEGRGRIPRRRLRANG
jgi:hypothetical protein